MELLAKSQHRLAEDLRNASLADAVDLPYLAEGEPLIVVQAHHRTLSRRQVLDRSSDDRHRVTLVLQVEGVQSIRVFELSSEIGPVIVPVWSMQRKGDIAVLKALGASEAA